MQSQIDFMGKRRFAVAVSLLLVVISVLLFTFRGLNYGLDFTGGTLVELRLLEKASPDYVREIVKANGFGDVPVQHLGTEQDFLIRIPANPADQTQPSVDKLSTLLADVFPGSSIRRAEFVGPAVGSELRNQGGIALLMAFGCITLYIMWRFTDKFAIGAIVALLHDVTITVGALSLFQWSVDLSTVAALMTVIGYSINDTIVVFDRIRENLRQLRKIDIPTAINISLNQTLERTLIMSGTTLAVLVGMMVLGGDVLWGFATALTIGVVVGTYSSIYIAAAYLLLSGFSREELFVPDVEAGSIKERQ